MKSASSVCFHPSSGAKQGALARVEVGCNVQNNIPTAPIILHSGNCICGSKLMKESDKW